MILKNTFPILILLFVGIVSQTSLNAQTSDEKWNRLTLLTPGTSLFVEGDGRRPVKGKLIRATGKSLILKTNGREIELRQDNISLVYYGRRPSRLKRGLIGALAGAGTGFLIGGIAAAGGADPLIAAGGVMVGIPAGAVVGIVTSGGMRKGELIYSR